MSDSIIDFVTSPIPPACSAERISYGTRPLLRSSL